MWSGTRGGWLVVVVVILFGCGNGRSSLAGAEAFLEDLRQRFPAAATRLRADLPPASRPSPHHGPLKPQEQQALAALAQRDAGWLQMRSPRRAHEPLHLAWQGLTVAVRSTGARPARQETAHGVAIYRDAFRDVDLIQVPGRRRAEELLHLRSSAAPTRFVYDVAVTNGSLHPSGVVVDRRGAPRLRVARPWAVDATGQRRDAHLAVRGSTMEVSLETQGLTFPVLLDPTWELTVGAMSRARFDHALVLLGSGQVLACGGALDAALVLESCDRFDAQGAGWSPAAAMAVPRRGLTLTLLPSGHVLACGGGAATCERYDPWADAWSVAAAMSVPRTGGTATLLRDGRVLMVGGDTTGATELYHHETDTWAAAGTISLRHGATATLLGDGRVLVVGGRAGTTPVNAVELFDPTTDAWAAGPSLPDGPRADHTATRLRGESQQVLVVGGTNGVSDQESALLFNELLNTWSEALRPLTVARREHAAALLPTGEVLVMGGRSGATVLGSVELYSPGGFWELEPLTWGRAEALAAVLSSGSVLLVGGVSPWGPVGWAERYAREPVGGWRPGAWMNASRYGHTVTLLADNRVLVTGGLSGETGGPVASCELYDPVDPANDRFVATGTMSEARQGHTATLLPSGDVLVVGGNGPGGAYLPSAERYDPGAGAWSSAGVVAPARSQHTATLLDSGQVLVTGGCASLGFNGSCGSDLAGTQLYDPVGNSWSPTGALGSARHGHTATLLDNGQVLVTGGSCDTCGGDLASAEVYTPGSGTWTAAADMSQARASHTATRLVDGRVVVAGGCVADGQERCAIDRASTEVYDPTDGSWAPSPSLSQARSQHAASLLSNGTILVTGGRGVATAELYDPSQAVWASAGSMALNRGSHRTVLLSTGRILVVGGGVTQGIAVSATASTELFDPGRGTFRRIPAMGEPRDGHTATLLPDGTVLIVGGSCDTCGGALASAELFDPQAITFTPTTGSMAEARALHTATLLSSGQVLLVGGYDTGGGGYATTSELFDIASGTFSPSGGLLQTRRSHRATLLPDGRVLVTGGYGGGDLLASAEIYQPISETFVSTGAMSQPRMRHSATLLRSGQVLVAGGYSPSGGVPGMTELYNPAAGTFTPSGIMLHHRDRHTALVLGSGLVLMIGGTCEICGALADAELYDPVTRSFTATGGLLEARSDHGAALLLDGRVLVAGGLGGHDGGDYFASAEVYDPAPGSCRSAGSMREARARPSLVAVTGGRVLVAGGAAEVEILQSAESLDLGERYPDGRQPTVDQPSLTVGPGAVVTLTGSNFRGLTQASSGLPGGAAVDHPGVHLRGLGSDLPWWVAPTSFADDSLTFTVPPGHPYEQAAVSVATAGAISRPVVLTVAPGGQGDGCSAPGECLSGFCVNGVCCASAACASCEDCNVAFAVGTCALVPQHQDDLEPAGTCTGANTCDGAGACLLKNGQACSGNGTSCASGLCIDGVCCDRTCSGTCRSCNVTDHVGFCYNVPAGEIDDGCDAAGQSCNGLGACKTVKGAACGADTDCLSQNCVDGVCCEDACVGLCRSCAVPGSLGTCTISPLFAIDPPTCLGANVCDGAGGCKLANGQLCADGAPCASGLCADGVCCESACTETCRSCAVQAHEGSCWPYNLGDDPESECSGAAGCEGACNGLGACTYPGSAQQCGPQTCAGHLVIVGDFCDGSGGCVPAAAEACGGGLVCNESGTACLTSCSGQENCQPDHYCDLGTGTCRVKSVDGSACENDDACASGHCVAGECCEAASCGGFVCEAGQCRTSCVRDDQCAAGWICDVVSGVCLAPAGFACEADSACQSNACAGGFCCGESCAHDDPLCGGTCDETGACSYPHDGRACTCDDGSASECREGTCRCEATDAGVVGGDGPVTTDPGEGGGCRAAPGRGGTGGMVLLVLLLWASSRRRPCGTSGSP